MKIYIFNYLDEKGRRTNTLTTTNKQTIDYSIKFANERNWKFEVIESEVKTQGKNESQLHKSKIYYEIPF